MQDVMVEDENFNTSCTGKVIHTLTTPGLITRTYMLLKHCQTFIFLTPPQLDDQQYKELLEIPKRILIPSPLWPLTPTTTTLVFDDSSKLATQTTSLLNTSDFKLVTSAPMNKSSPYPPPQLLQCPIPPPPYLFHLALHPLTLSLPLLLKAQLTQKWLFPMNR